MTDTPPQTIIITGISPHSPLSTHIATHLLSQLSSSTSTISASSNISLALLGPSLPHLTQTVSRLHSLFPQIQIQILPFEVNIKSAQSIGITAHSIRAAFGAADIVIHNPSAFLEYPSGTTGTLTPIRGADEDDWWDVFEVNVRSIQFVARHFFTKMREGAVFVDVLSVGMHDSAETNGTGGGRGGERGMSAWDASAAAAERVVSHLRAENGVFRVECAYVRQGGAVSEEDARRVVGLLGM